MNITDINGETKMIAFFGSTYKVSKMYKMYNSAIQALGLNYMYVPCIVDDIGKATEGIRHLGFAAIGITIPYKEPIMPYLDELDDNAKRIGAVNVVINKNGKLIGANTDGEGAIQAIEEKTSVKGKKVALLGAGGAAKATAFALKDAGTITTIFNRTVEKAEELAKASDNEWAPMDDLEKLIPETDIIINATSIGMVGTSTESQSILKSEWLNPNQTIMEMVNKPKETKLVQDALETGCEVVYGYRMLLWQGVRKFKMYTGVEPPIEVMEDAMEKMQNA